LEGGSQFGALGASQWEFYPNPLVKSNSEGNQGVRAAKPEMQTHPQENTGVTSGSRMMLQAFKPWINTPPFCLIFLTP
jgi:hypothetical protein